MPPSPASSAVAPCPGIRSGGKHINFTRCSYYRLVPRPPPTGLDSCLTCWVSAQHVVPYIRWTQRHSHTYFCEELTGSFAACYEVSRGYADDGSLRLERRSVGDGNPRFGGRSPPLRHYSGDRSLRLGRHSSQRRHGGLRTRRRPPPSHAPRSSQTAAPARRSLQRRCSTPPPPGHAVAIDLRCGKADTEALISSMKLDLAFARKSGGRSTFFLSRRSRRD